MKIALVIPSLGSGGAERVISILANHWANRSGCAVDLIVLSAGQAFYEIDPRVTVHQLGYVGGKRGVAKIIGLLRGGCVLRTILKQIKPDVVLSFIREANILTLLFSRFLGVRVVISERDSAEAIVSPVYSYLRRLTYPWANGIIVQTEHYKRFIVKEVGNDRVGVIANPVKKIEQFHLKKEKVVITVGRLIEEKGQSYLLTAFKKSKHASDWQLAILGDGALKASLASEAIRLGISERVTFVGATKDVDRWLGRASIFAFPSVSEGFPNALAEAMSAGLPCISFNCVAGPSDLIEDGVNGFLVDVHDVDGLADRLDKLMCSSELREKFSIAARLVSSRLDANQISDEYYSFLSRC